MLKNKIDIYKTLIDNNTRSAFFRNRKNPEIKIKLSTLNKLPRLMNSEDLFKDFVFVRIVEVDSKSKNINSVCVEEFYSSMNDAPIKTYINEETLEIVERKK